MSFLLELFLIVWGASFVVLAAALTIVVLVQGATRHARALAARLRSDRRPAGSSLNGRQTQPV